MLEQAHTPRASPWPGFDGCDACKARLIAAEQACMPSTDHLQGLAATVAKAQDNARAITASLKAMQHMLGRRDAGRATPMSGPE